MSNRIACTYATEGTLARNAARPQFRVIEGGAAHAATAHGHGTRRRHGMPRREARVLCAAACCVMVVLGALWYAGDIRASARRQQAFAAASYETIVVMPGETLWSIAQQHPVQGCTTAEVVRHISQSNALGSGLLTSGMELSVPVGA